MTWTSLEPNKRPTPISPLPTVPAASALAIHTAFVTADDAARIAKAVKRAYRTACGRKGHIPMQALSAMVARNKTRLRLSLEEDNPSEEVIAALGRVWEAYNRMIAMGSVTVKEEPPTPPVAGYLEGSFTAEGG